MEPYHLLVPTDFSDGSLASLRWAVSLARAQRPAVLTLFHADAGLLPVGDASSGPSGPHALMRQAKLQAAEQ